MGRRDDIKGITGGEASGTWLEAGFDQCKPPLSTFLGLSLHMQRYEDMDKVAWQHIEEQERKLPGSKHGTQNKKDTERYPRCARWSNGWPHWRTMSHTWEGATSWRSAIWGWVAYSVVFHRELPCVWFLFACCTLSAHRRQPPNKLTVGCSKPETDAGSHTHSIPSMTGEEWQCRYTFGYGCAGSDYPCFPVWPEHTEAGSF